ncbi:MAG TPA: ribosome recycling factor [Oscillospiraceae bacterium]|nr:ribosome recycling factor [Oscillospiraceae bacterium]
MKELYANSKERMDKTINSLEIQYASIRAGRANAAVLDRINIDYYGVPTPINQVAAISVAEARILNIQPWDASIIDLVIKAIQSSDLGINPQNDGRVIRLVFPPLTEERRKVLVRDINRISEESKIGIRQIRRDSMERLKAMEKASEITEDDLKVGEKELQNITDDYIKKIDDIAKTKELEVMEI